MKTRFCACLALLFALGSLSPRYLSPVARAADINKAALYGGISSDGAAYVTLSPAEGGFLYALSSGEPAPGDPGIWRAAENGAVSWDSLAPGGAYCLLYRPAESDVPLGQIDFLAPPSLPSADALLREPDFEPLFDSLTLSAPDPDCEYALAGPGIDELDWQSGNSSSVVYEHLAFDQEYTLLIRGLGLSDDVLCLPSSAPISILPDVVLSSRLSALVDARGYGCISVADGDSSMQYAALTADGTVASLRDGSCAPLTLSGLLPGREYLVTARALSEPLSVGDSLPARGAAISVPALYGDLSLTAGFCETPGTLFLQLDPACPDAEYAVLGGGGRPVPDIRAFDGSGTEISGDAGWFLSSGSLRFEALSTGAAYSLALRDKNGMPSVLCDFTLPQNLPVLQESDVLLSADSLSFTGQTGVQYALASADGLSLASVWQSGGDQTLTFGHLTAGQTYRLLLREGDDLPVSCFAFTPAEKAPSTQPVPPTSPSAPGGAAPSLPDQSKEEDAPAKRPAAGAERLLVTDRRVAYIMGEPNGRFRPDGHLTRAEMCMLFYRLLREIPDASAVSYADVPEDAWYFPPVSALTALEIVQGAGEGRFSPNVWVTRAEFSAMAARFCLPAEAAFDFSDLTPGHWAYPFVCTACANGWLRADEDGAFRPNQPLSRGEAVHALNLILGRAPEPSLLESQGLPPAFSDLQPESPWYYDIWEATLSDSDLPPHQAK